MTTGRALHDPALEYRTGVARLLNRGGLSAAPLRRLPAISIFDDEEYENYEEGGGALSLRERVGVRV